MTKQKQQIIQQFLTSPYIPSIPIFSKNASNIQNSLLFPVHRIYCIGRNYREHAIEMGHNPDREPPFYFMKPADAAICTKDKQQIPYPSKTSKLHYEGELMVAIGQDFQSRHKEGEEFQTLSKDDIQNANDSIFGYAVGCDLTRRDLQANAKQQSRPWCAAKGFDYSAPCGPILPKQESNYDLSILSYTEADDPSLTLSVNGELRQSTNLHQMIYSIPEIIHHMSNYVTLKTGDIIMTGTPAGVGSLDIGDTVTIYCADLPSCEFTMIHSS